MKTSDNGDAIALIEVILKLKETVGQPVDTGPRGGGPAARRIQILTS